MKVRRPAGRQHVQMLVAYGVRRDGTRQLLGFLRTRGESQAHGEALLNDLYRRGLEGDKLLLVVTDGCPGLAAAIQTVYSRAAHQRCWVHKMCNILEKVRQRDYDAVKAVLTKTWSDKAMVKRRGRALRLHSAVEGFVAAQRAVSDVSPTVRRSNIFSWARCAESRNVCIGVLPKQSLPECSRS